MLTRDNLDTIDNQSGESGDRNKAFELNMREQYVQ